MCVHQKSGTPKSTFHGRNIGKLYYITGKEIGPTYRAGPMLEEFRATVALLAVKKMAKLIFLQHVTPESLDMLLNPITAGGEHKVLTPIHLFTL